MYYSNYQTYLLILIEYVKPKIKHVLDKGVLLKIWTQVPTYFKRDKDFHCFENSNKKRLMSTVLKVYKNTCHIILAKEGHFQGH